LWHCKLATLQLATLLKLVATLQLAAVQELAAALQACVIATRGDVAQQ